jgi:DNA-directed RNA polymerase subunit RPC12/RpoP
MKNGMRWTKAMAGILAMGVAMATMATAEAGEMWVQCKYCGHKARDVRSLTGNACMRHPEGPGKGRHAVYEGSEKGVYTCKWCGKQTGDIAGLTSSRCIRHPAGAGKGWHEPAL